MLTVLKPTQITNAMLISSTVPENDGTADGGAIAHNIATAYVAANRCISLVTHLIYECVTANSNKDPTDLNNQFGTPVYWKVVGPTNRWKMFDGQSSSQTEVASPLTVVLQPEFFDELYLGNLDAEHIEMTVKDAPGGNVIRHYSADLENSEPADYDEYFWMGFRPQTDFIADNIDPYFAAELTITLTSASGLVKCGLFAVGDAISLGDTLRGPEVSPKTYSYINTDNFGNNNIVRGKSAKDVTLTAVLDLIEADYVVSVLNDVQDVPCLYSINLPNHSSLNCFGLGAGKVIYDQATTCTLNLPIKGLI